MTWDQSNLKVGDVVLVKEEIIEEEDYLGKHVYYLANGARPSCDSLVSRDGRLGVFRLIVIGLDEIDFGATSEGGQDAWYYDYEHILVKEGEEEMSDKLKVGEWVKIVAPVRNWDYDETHVSLGGSTVSAYAQPTKKSLVQTLPDGRGVFKVKVSGLIERHSFRATSKGDKETWKYAISDLWFGEKTSKGDPSNMIDLEDLPSVDRTLISDGDEVLVRVKISDRYGPSRGDRVLVERDCGVIVGIDPKNIVAILSKKKPSVPTYHDGREACVGDVARRIHDGILCREVKELFSLQLKGDWEWPDGHINRHSFCETSQCELLARAPREKKERQGGFHLSPRIVTHVPAESPFTPCLLSS